MSRSGVLPERSNDNSASEMVLHSEFRFDNGGDMRGSDAAND